jgi:lipase maturation factor 1
MPGSYTLSHWLFPKLLGFVYLIAFISLARQVDGLYGSGGIAPIHAFVRAAREAYGKKTWRYFPSLFLLRSSDAVIRFAATAGIALSLLLVSGIQPVPVLVLLYILYLSFVSVGEEFLSYQWDALLLETGVVAIFFELAPPGPFSAFAMQFFFFRFMFSAGTVKLTSGDPNWRNLTAMTYHYETQPLPNRVAWYAHQLPLPVQKLSTFGTFVFENGVPFLAFGPAPLKLACFLLSLFFQFLIAATGSYGFFNLLAVLLAVPLLDDRYLEWLTPLVRSLPAYPAWISVAAEVGLGIVILLNALHLLYLFHRPRLVARLFSRLAPFEISNPYGLFAVMTTKRYEFVLEGSDDHENWRDYEFRWKPGNPSLPPRQAAPHQPRLDWQMWFAALNPVYLEPWLKMVVVRLLQENPEVLGLLEKNPFPAGAPRYIRLVLYIYKFTNRETRRRTGKWWERKLLEEYPPMALKGPDSGRGIRDE